MAGPSTTTVTVDRISNSGNAIAKEEVAGKTVHAPADVEIGDTLEVKLVDKGGFFEATLVDRATETQPRQPGLSPDTSDIAEDLLDPTSDLHCFETSKAVQEKPKAPKRMSRMSSRKMG